MPKRELVRRIDQRTAGSTGTSNADTVDGLHASRIPTAGQLLALGANTQFPANVVEISDLIGVTIDAPTDNEVLAYDSVLSKWINQTADEANLQTKLTTGDLTASAPLQVNATRQVIGGSAVFSLNQAGIDHGSIGGLSDDDHAQYLLASGSRAGATAQAQSFGTNGIAAARIVEATTDAGVLVEDVLLKDSGASLGGGIKLPLATKTAGYTATAQDHTILVDASGGAVTITLPAAANAWDNIRNAGSVLTIKKIDSTANVVTIDGSGSETIDGSLTQTLSTQWDKLSVQSNGTAWFII